MSRPAGADSGITRTWPPRPGGILFGADYNPEQWPDTVLEEDVRLMAQAGVNFVTLAVFSWAWLEPRPGHYEFGWLDRVMDTLASAGIAVDLATATASPPPWFSRAYPDSLPMREDGTRLWPGSRQTFCPSNPDYRRAAVSLATAIAEHYRDHPALILWHVHNEYGCHNAHCYCDISAQAFRNWLERRYGDLDRLNQAWGTAFWSQRYSDWEEIWPPRQSTTWRNPTQQLDFKRFSSDELLDCFRAERDALRRITPRVPVTTNFMSFFRHVDYRAWAKEVDLVSNDHYLLGHLPEPHVDLAMSGDLMRSLAGGPWLLMEHSPSAVQWQARNFAKAPGQMRRNSLSHAARGADGIAFFQWRQSRAGAEKFHSGMVPHAGTDTKTWREVVRLGADLEALAEVRSTVVAAEVAIAFTWDSWWAAELDAHPTADLDILGQVREWYSAFWHQGTTVDFVDPADFLGRYRLVVVPSLYLITDAQVESLRAYVEGGGRLIVTYFSAIVDENDHVRLGGYPAPLRDLLGLRIEEFYPLAAGETIRLSGGSAGTVWSELGRADSAEVLETFTHGSVAGSPAITRHRFGAGTAWYVATRLDPPALTRLVAEVTRAAGVPVYEKPPGVEIVRRQDQDRTYLFAMNHSDQDAILRGVAGTDLLTGATFAEAVPIPASGVLVLRETVGGA